MSEILTKLEFDTIIPSRCAVVPLSRGEANRLRISDAALREVIRQAVLDIEKLPHAPSCASGNGEWRLEEKGDCITREFYLYGTPCNCGHAAAIANLKKAGNL